MNRSLHAVSSPVCIGCAAVELPGDDGQKSLVRRPHRPFPRYQKRQAQAVVDLPELPVSFADAGLFDGTRRCVEAGMEYGAVALAGAIQDIPRLFRQNDPGALQGKPARDGAAHDAGTHHEHVAGLVL